MNLDIKKDEIKFRRYESELGFTSEFEMIRKMLTEANSNKMRKRRLQSIYLMNSLIDYLRVFKFIAYQRDMIFLS